MTGAGESQLKQKTVIENKVPKKGLRNEMHATLGPLGVRPREAARPQTLIIGRPKATHRPKPPGPAKATHA